MKIYEPTQKIPNNLISEWHPTKNEGLRASDINQGSYEFVWWLCSNGHEFGMTIRERYNKDLACPECLKIDRARKRTDSRELNKERSLLEMDSELSKQWHPTLNGDKTPQDVTYNEKWPTRWWKCHKGHEWEERVKDRYNNPKSVCIYCSDQKAYQENCLATVHPELAKEWWYFKNENLLDKLTPYDVVHNSNYEAFWVCREEGHIWKEKVNKRVNNDPGCPECKKLKTSLEVFDPELAKEWHPEKNQRYFDDTPLTPRDVQYNSYESAWWICKHCKNEFSARIKDRHKQTSNCNICFPNPAKARSISPGSFKKKTAKNLEDDRILFEKKLREQKNSKE